ncbi:hypothetical protein CLUG_05320 [Clavispora lusitaniae ATCC 42720]|uniref:Dol-P-Man:Man(5)GlcNAc(2)-PP-Dol alpha-1,3-mannosyltransferase n=1 Tax=Clavispora lusitaniae (strain ATCC 42720) TaxID=306902 RepID=C4YB28_CLAL4|nr:uncharacterized protein CLUG_05320 [Clavispora lusitaniae ATCC 42720]EEQ41192.1 hypothetical protein CLUG_05320 [Clavispora lusitaniae ATCC 42720]
MATNGKQSSAVKNTSNESSDKLPQLTLKSVLSDVYNGAYFMVFDPQACKVAAPIVVSVASILCKIVISKVNYTEIDFSTYMQQIELVNAGALDYSLIEGDTGPIVYPAGFIQVYQLLYWLTDGGVNIQIAQKAFGYLFAITVAFTCAVYTMVGNLPPWPLYLLLCSKRLVSIYVLRMFNDCFTTLGMVCVVLLLQVASYYANTLSDGSMLLLCGVAADVFSMAISVKMNALLYLPAFIIVVYFLVGERLLRLAGVLLVIPAVQVLIGWRFLLPLFWDEEARYIRWTYLSQAFNFGRKFLHKWTVNWKFVPEEIFLSDEFALGLLAVHVILLLALILVRFLSPKIIKKPLSKLVKDAIYSPCTKTTAPGNLLLTKASGPRLILLMFATTNLVGVLCARSLHYQFLSWYCWSLPFLLYVSGSSLPIAATIFVAHESCWNVYPSTPESSKMLVLLLATTLLAVVINNDIWGSATDADSEEKKTR